MDARTVPAGDVGDRLGRLPSRWPTYLLLFGSVVAILAVGLGVPALVAQRIPAAPAVTGPTATTVPPPARDHDHRRLPEYANSYLVTSPPPPRGTPLLASGTGVTPTTVTLGVILPGLGALSSFGIDVSQLDPKIQQTYWDAAVARINATGGVDGRRLVVSYATADILSQDSMRAACRTLTEDRRVFAVANMLGISGDPILCVTRDHATPYLGIDGDDASYYQISQGRLVTLEPSTGRTVALFAQRLSDMDLLRGRRVGVVHGTGPGGIDGGAVKATLLGAGAASVVDAPLGNQDPLTVTGEVAQAERRMHRAGVDTVVLFTNAVFGTVFADQANQERYTPEYLMSDLGFATAGDSFLANMPPSFFRHALAVTTTEVGRGRAGLPESRLDAGCRLNYQSFIGHTVTPESADAVAALASCALVQLLVMGFNGAGPNPTQAAFSAALDHAGAFAVPGFGRGFLAPGRLDAADEVSVIAARADCQCYQVIDGFRPAPPFAGFSAG